MKTITRQRGRARIRAKINGTPERPRLVATISNRHIVAQIIDDSSGKTLASATTNHKALKKGTMTEKATQIGTEIAEAAAKTKVKRVVFDRAGRIYHGRLHALAEAARAKGLEF